MNPCPAPQTTFLTTKHLAPTLDYLTRQTLYCFDLGTIMNWDQLVDDNLEVLETVVHVEAKQGQEVV